MNLLRIAFRNLARQKKRTILLGGAIAFGVMIITLVGSFTRGITDSAAANFTDILGGQIYITGRELTGSGAPVSVIRDQDVLADALVAIEGSISDRTFRSRALGEIIFGSRSGAVSIEGVDWQDEPDLVASLDVASGSVTANTAPGMLVIPRATAEEIGVEPGEQVLVRASTVTGQQNVAEFTIAAILESNSFLSTNSAYAGKASLNSLIGLEADAHQVLNISLHDPSDAQTVTDKLVAFFRDLGRAEPEEESEGDGMRSRVMRLAALMGSNPFGGKVEEADRWEGTRFSVLNIDDMMEAVTRMVDVLDAISFTIFVTLILITMVGLLNTFRMVLIERTREIGTMRAIGMQRNDVRDIFLLEALLLALLGVAAGIVLSLSGAGILGSIPVSADSPMALFLADGSFTFPVVPVSIFTTFIIVSLITLSAAVFPARRAARLDPAVALRATF